MVGLGRMGSNMARRLMKGGHECVAFDLNPARVMDLAGEGAQPAASLKDLISKLESPAPPGLCFRQVSRPLHLE